MRRKSALFGGCGALDARISRQLAPNAFAKIISRMHNKRAFQASSPKTPGRPSGRSFFICAECAQNKPRRSGVSEGEITASLRHIFVTLLAA